MQCSLPCTEYQVEIEMNGVSGIRNFLVRLRTALPSDLRTYYHPFIYGLVGGLSAVCFQASKEAAGSGIPQVKAAFWRDFGYLPFRVVVAKFFAGVITIGGGSSLGREGPTVISPGHSLRMSLGCSARPNKSEGRPCSRGQPPD